MSKRYGRNQRRKARETIRNHEIAAAANTRRLAKAVEERNRLDEQVKGWARRIVARLGHDSAFALDKSIREWTGGESLMVPYPERMPLWDRLDNIAERMTYDLIQMFVHHVESTYDKKGGRDMRGQLVLHLYRGKEHEPLYIALSAQQMDEIRYSRDEQYMSFLIKGLARQFARHAEEMQRGR